LFKFMERVQKWELEHAKVVKLKEVEEDLGTERCLALLDKLLAKRPPVRKYFRNHSELRHSRISPRCMRVGRSIGGWACR